MRDPGASVGVSFESTVWLGGWRELKSTRPEGEGILRARETVLGAVIRMRGDRPGF